METPSGSGVQMSPNMTPTSKWSAKMTIVATLIGVIIVGGVVYAVAHKSSPATSPTATPTASSVEVGAWKTYSSDSLRVSFEYPSTPVFTITETQSSIAATTANPPKYPAISIKHTVPVMPECPSGIRELCGNVTNNPEVKIIVLNQSYATVTTPLKKVFTSSWTDKTIGNYTGIWGDMGVEGFGEWIFIFPLTDGRTVYLSSNYVMESYLQSFATAPGWIPFTQQQDIFTHVIESLIVANTQSASPVATPTPSATPVSTLKTYSNTQLAYTLKYPSDWSIGPCGANNCQGFMAQGQNDFNFRVLYYGNYGDDRDLVEAVAIEKSAGYQCQESIQNINGINWTKRVCAAIYVSYIVQSQQGVYKIDLGAQSHPMYAKSLAIAQSIKLTSFSTPTPTPAPIEISIISPAGGEQWKVGETYTIKWTISGAKYNSITWYKGSTGGLIAEYYLVSANNGVSSFQWTVPDSLVAGSDYVITISAKRNDEVGPPADKWVYSKAFSIVK